MEFPKLNTKRLVLDKITKEHIPSYYDVLSREVVTKYYGMDSLKSLEEASKLVESLQQTYESRRGIRWGIFLAETGEFVGTVGLNNLSTWSKRAEVGYELHPNHWNKGITTEAVEEVLRYSFEGLGLNRMGAVTYPQNESSIKLLKRLGFKNEGLLRGYLYQNGKSNDAFVFSILNSEWNR
ncbi:GNAT family N-acetyltransferase [Ornithinibacillus sp. L9]|uniref:GNAT family N-acetyltransferase n=1 Tax=Ornithinibacillus caprae TaxID=2678566 RepID=A0A6N8FIR9_9BACI|nr:GNAT family protein [Ornithinibacillus caprae]MUK89500.1 GNAT family N-acetyltransferase [Ornithinibacillus caprae]